MKKEPCEMFTLPMLEGLFLLFNQLFEKISLLDFAGGSPIKVDDIFGEQANTFVVKVML